MRDRLIQSIESRFVSYLDLISSVDDAALARKLNVPKAKSLAEHLWCVVGARQSHAQAFDEGQWKGFSCSMTSFTQKDFCKNLHSSAESVSQALARVSDWTAARDRLLITLAEHEVMHEGQIIRHMYGLDMTIPQSVRWA